MPGRWIVDNLGLREVEIGFSEAITTPIPEGAITIWTVGAGAMTDFTAAYDGTTDIVTVSFASPIRDDRLTIVVDYSVTDPFGNELDGEITDPANAVLPSGDGVRGGQAVFRINILQGDANRDGVVDGVDGSIIAASLGRCTNDAGFDPMGDLSLDGCVNAHDAAIFMQAEGRSLSATDGIMPIVTAVREPATGLLGAFDRIVIDFNEVVADSMINERTCFLIDGSGNLIVPASGVGGPFGRTAVYNFMAPLPQCGTYTINISNGLADSSGELLVTPSTPPILTGLIPPPAPGLNAHTTMTTASSVTIAGSAPGGDFVEVVCPPGSEAACPTGTVTVPVTNGVFSIKVPLGPDRVNHLFFTTLSACAGALGPLSPRSPPTVASVTHDTEPPHLFIDFPVDGAQITTATTDVAGRVGDMLSGFMGLQVQLVVNGDTANPIDAIVDVGIGNNGTFFAPSVPLGPIDKPTVIDATATDAMNNAITTQIAVTQTAIPPDAPQMVVVSGNGQAGPMGTVLASPIVVRMAQDGGTPVSPFVNKVVTFKVTRSNGRLGATVADITPTPDNMDPGSMMYQVHTDAAGEARAYWRLGYDAGCGNNRVEVASMSIAGTVAFCASATPAPVNQINIGMGNNQRAEAGGPAPEPLRVWVSDACNGIPGQPILFTVVRGGGKVRAPGTTLDLDSATVPTADTGHAEVSFTLGPDWGNNVIEATVPAFPDVFPARFVIFGLARDGTVATSFSGIVLNNASQPIGGATCRLAVGGVFMPDTITDIDGRFRFDNVSGSGKTDLYVDGSIARRIGGATCLDPVCTDPTCEDPACETSPCCVPPGTFPSLHYETTVVPNAPNSLPTPVLLPPLNPGNMNNTYSATPGGPDTVLTVDGVEGLEMIVKAGSMTLGSGQPAPDGQPIYLNQVHADDIPMPIPDGASPPFAWTLQPSGARFDPPIKITYPNMSGLPPGSIAYFLSFNHDTSRFEIVATGQVTGDGSRIVTDPGTGLFVAGWGCNCPPYSVTGDCCSSCEAECCEGTCCGSSCACCTAPCCNGVCCEGGECCGGECCLGRCCGGECCIGGVCCGDECCADCCNGECCDTLCCEGVCCPAGAKSCCDGECCLGFCCEETGECCAPTDKSCCNNGCCAGPCCENTGECCPAGKESCCNDVCCDGPCCGENDDICCEAGATCCGLNCCPPETPQCCDETGTLCCPDDQDCCDTKCCPVGWTCCNGACCPGPCCENTGECCAESDKSCCNDACCAGPCCDATGECCSATDESCCNNECCGGPCCNDQCCPHSGGACCSTSLSGCCAPNELCCEATGGGCCPSGEFCCGEGQDACCPVGIVCCDRGCCLAGEMCCGGDTCCDPDKCCDNNECCEANETCCNGVCALASCSLSVQPGAGCPGSMVELSLTGDCDPDCDTMSFSMIKSVQFLTVNLPGPMPCLGSPHVDTFTVEIASDAPPGPIVFQIIGTTDAAECTTLVTVTVIEVDLDVDSDNNNGTGLPDRSPAEDAVEMTAPGKLLCVNDDDDDANGVADKDQEPPPAGDDDLVRMVMELDHNDPGGTWRLQYDASRVQVYEDNRVTIVPPGQVFNMPLAPNPKNFWVEGVAVTPGGPTTVTLDVDLDGDGTFECTDSVVATVIRVDLDVDTDRNGLVEDADDADEDLWVADRGGLFMVNYDDDDGNGEPDAIRFTDLGEPTSEDTDVDNAADVNDIAPLIVRATGPTVGVQFFLKMASDDLKAVHIFEERAAGKNVLWGGWAAHGGDTGDKEIDITAQVNAASDVDLGIEALFFRGQRHDLPGGGPYDFDGEIDIELIAQATTGATSIDPARIVCSDKIRLKVAPYLMLPNTQDAIEVWMDIDTRADDIAAKFGAVARRSVSPSQWFQDHVQIGYTGMPNQSMHIVLRMPYSPVQHSWPEGSLLSSGGGLVRFRNTRVHDGSNSGDYGGNLEVVPPSDEWPLGRIVYGNTMSMNPTEADLPTFLKNQKLEGPDAVQEPFDIDVNWLSVGHVDEIINFLPGGTRGFKVVVASPSYAQQLLFTGDPARGIAPPSDDTAVFAIGAQASGTASNSITTDSRVYLFDGVAHGQIKVVAGVALTDGETVTVSDGALTRTFEFDKSGGVAPGNTAIPITDAMNPTLVRDALLTAINGAVFNIDAVPDDFPLGTPDKLILINQDFGIAGNVPITETVGPGGFVVHGMTGGEPTSDGMDFTTTAWKYIRIYDGPGAGQVGLIDGPSRRGKGWLSVQPTMPTQKTVFVTTSKIVSAPRANQNDPPTSLYQIVAEPADLPTDVAWMPEAGTGSRYILATDTKHWYRSGGTAPFPALVSVFEVKNNTELWDLNAASETVIGTARSKVQVEMGSASGGGLFLRDDNDPSDDSLSGDPDSDFVVVPVIYFGDWSGSLTPRGNVAFTPGLANVQPANAAMIVFPESFASDTLGMDVFEVATTAIIGAGARFADDWDLYHRRDGEVHCATEVVRILFALDWWENQP